MKEKAKHIGIFSFFTLLSRILGLLRDMLKAYALGTSLYAVAFDIAFRIPNMLRNLVAEGTFSHALLPIYKETSQKSSRKETLKAMGSILGFWILVLLFILLLFYLLLPPFLSFLLKKGDSSFQELTLSLSYFLFPYILFISLASFFMGILYAEKIFSIPSSSPFLMNLWIIIFFGGYLIFFPSSMEKSLWIFSIATLTASIFSLFLQVFFVYKKVGKIFPSLKKNPVVKKLFFLMLPGVLSSILQELSQLVDIYLATLLLDKIPGAVSALSYAHRLMHLPMGVLGVAISTSSLVEMSHLLAKNQREKFISSLEESIRLLFYLLLPASIGLLLLREEIIKILLERGAFDKTSTSITSYPLLFYSLGLPFFSLNKLFLSSFYAQKNTKIPLFIQGISVILNLFLSLALLPYLYHGGIALATSFSALVGSLLYAFFLYHKKLLFPSKDLLFPLGKIFLLNLLFFLFLKTTKSLLSFSSLAILGILIPSSVGFYLLASYLFKIKEFSFFLSLVRKTKRG